MSTKLQYKSFNDFGQTTRASNLLGSGDWIHAATKAGIDKSTTNNIFDYWQNHSFLKTSRYAQGVGGLGKQSTNINPYGQESMAYNPLQFAKRTAKEHDPFSLARAATINKHKHKYTDFSQNADGTASYYKTKTIREYSSDPYGNKWTTTKPYVNPNANAGPYSGSRNRQPKSRDRVLIGQRGEKVEGRVLNGAFVEQSAYDQMSEVDRKFYGLTNRQAERLDPNLKIANQVVDAAYQYRRGRSRKKTGLGAAIGAFAPKLLTIAGTAFGGPVGGAIGGAISGGLQSGGDLGEVLKGGVTGYAAGTGAKVGGDIWSGAGGAATNAGPVALSNGGSNVGLFDGLFKGGGNLLGDFSKGIGDIFNGGLSGIGDAFKGGAGGIGNFLTGGGNAGGIGDLLNFGTGGVSGGIGNILSGIGGGNIGQLLSGAGGLGLLDGLLGGNGQTPGINPGAGGGGGSAGGGSSQTLPAWLQGIITGGGVYASDKTADQLKDAGKKGADVADPFRHSRGIYEDKLNALYNDPSTIENLPGFKFGLDQGNKALQRRADAGGYTTSGNALIEAAQFGQDYGQKYFGDEVNRLALLSGGANGALGTAGGLLANGYGGYADKYGEISGQAGDLINQLLGKQQQSKVANQGGSAVSLIEALLKGRGNSGGGSVGGSVGGGISRPGWVIDDPTNPYDNTGAY